MFDPISRVLVVTASPRESDSESIQLTETLLGAYREGLGTAPVATDYLNTFSDLAAFDAREVDAKMAVVAGRDVPQSARAAWDRVSAVAERVMAADTLIFAVPMWNGAIPWSLKLFIDTVTQPGIAFSFSPSTGYRGLFTGRRAVAIYTSRVYRAGLAPNFGADHQSGYLHWWLRSVGVDDVRDIRLQPTYPDASFVARRDVAHRQARRLGADLAVATRTGRS